MDTPRQIGDYGIVGVLGRGGMGTVYEAEEAGTRRRVAIKVVHGGALSDPESLSLFRREIRALARLDHPGIAALHAAGATEDGTPYFVMALVDGTPLDAWGARQPGLDRKVDVIVKTCDAVAHAHAHGVVHRDLKPGNVLVRERDGVDEVKVLDFGLARVVEGDGAGASRVTEVGTLRGTVRYMSPEQLAGDPDEVDARSDVYALGVLLYELVTGSHPHDSDAHRAFELPGRILNELPRPISRARAGGPRVDADLATVVMKCLEKEPERRYATVPALADDLRRWRSRQPIAARPPSTAYQIRKMIARNRTGAALFGAAAAAGVLAIVALAVLSSRLAGERDRAAREAEAARSNAAAFTRILMQRNPVVGEPRLDNPESVTAMIDEIARSWDGDPEGEIELLRTAGVALFGNGSFEAGLRFAERAGELERERTPDWTRRWASVGLGEMYHRAGRLEEAEAIFRSNLEALRGSSAPNSANGLGYAEENLGCVLRDLGRLDEAEAHLEEARRSYEAETVPDVRLLASIHDSLGNLHLARGDLQRAEASHRKAFELRGGVRGPAAPEYFQSVHDLGVVLLQAGKLGEAEPLLRRALEGRQTRLGPSHPDTEATLVAIGELEAHRGRIDVARAHLARATRIYERGLPRGHPTTSSLRAAIAQGSNAPLAPSPSETAWSGPRDEGQASRRSPRPSESVSN